MNICLSCSDDDFSEEIHYSEQEEETEEESDIEVTSETTYVLEDEFESSRSEKLEQKGKQFVLPFPEVNYFYPF